MPRVDGQDGSIIVPQRRLSFDCKTSRPMFGQQIEGIISHTTTREGHITSRDDMEKVQNS